MQAAAPVADELVADEHKALHALLQEHHKVMSFALCTTHESPAVTHSTAHAEIQTRQTVPISHCI